MNFQTNIQVAKNLFPISNSFSILNKPLMYKINDEGTICYIDSDNKEQILFKVGFKPIKIFYWDGKFYI